MCPDLPNLSISVLILFLNDGDMARPYDVGVPKLYDTIFL